MGIGGREFAVGRLAGCRILFAESTPAALRLGLRMKLKMQTLGRHGKKNRPTQNTPRNSQPFGDRDQLGTARAKHVPRVSPHSPASIDPGFVEISLVQLSQSVKTTNVFTHTDRHRLNNGTLYAPRYEEYFFPIGKKRRHHNKHAQRRP